MRTTLTLDADVSRMIEDEVHRQRRPFKQVVNDALRRGLAPRTRRAASRRYRVKAHAANLRPGLDAARLNALADELEDRVLVSRSARRRSS